MAVLRLLHRPANPEYSRITLQTMVYLFASVRLASYTSRALQHLSYFFLLPFGFQRPYFLLFRNCLSGLLGFVPLAGFLPAPFLS